MGEYTTSKIISISLDSGDIAITRQPDVHSDQVFVYGRVDCLHRSEQEEWNPQTDTVVQFLNLLEEKNIHQASMALEGQYLAILKRERATYVFCDRFALLPFFYEINTDRVILFDRLLDEDRTFTLDPKSVPAFLLFRYVPGSATLFKNIYQFMPGVTLKIDHDRQIQLL